MWGLLLGSDVFRIHLRDSWEGGEDKSSVGSCHADGDEKDPLANSAGTKQPAPRPTLAAVEGNSQSLRQQTPLCTPHKHGLMFLCVKERKKSRRRGWKLRLLLLLTAAPPAAGRTRWHQLDEAGCCPRLLQRVGVVGLPEEVR